MSRLTRDGIAEPVSQDQTLRREPVQGKKHFPCLADHEQDWQPDPVDPCGTGRLNPSRETKFSGTHGDRGILIFSVQLTTSRIGNLTRLIHTLLYVMTVHTHIHTYILLLF